MTDIRIRYKLETGNPMVYDIEDWVDDAYNEYAPEVLDYIHYLEETIFKLESTEHI